MQAQSELVVSFLLEVVIFAIYAQICVRNDRTFATWTVEERRLKEPVELGSSKLLDSSLLWIRYLFHSAKSHIEAKCAFTVNLHIDLLARIITDYFQSIVLAVEFCDIADIAIFVLSKKQLHLLTTFAVAFVLVGVPCGEGKRIIDNYLIFDSKIISRKDLQHMSRLLFEA